MFAPKASLRGGEAQQLFPADVQTIPEFVVVDLQIMTSHSGNSEKGYGIKLQRVSLNPTTLYSYLTKQSLLAIPGSYLESVEDAVGKSRASQFVANQLEVKNTSFFSKVPPNAFISSTPVCDGLYRLVGQGGSELFPGVPCVDIKESDLLKFANIPLNSPAVGFGGSAAGFGGSGTGQAAGALDASADDVQDAITLFDFASAAEALYVYVTSVPTFKSRDPAMSDFLGVPMVDSDQFLKSVEFPGALATEDGEIVEDKVLFPFRHEIVTLSDKPLVTVFTSAVFNATGPPAPCPDFALMSEVCSVKKGYIVSIGRDDAPDILRFIFNVTGCQFSPNGCPSRLDYVARLGKRKALCSGAQTPEDGDE